jgi:hypothetical protein
MVGRMGADLALDAISIAICGTKVGRLTDFDEVRIRPDRVVLQR